MQSHLWIEQGVATVDLHDLNVDLAKGVVAAVVAEAEQLQTGAVRFITGWGRHSVGIPVLPGVIQGALLRLERERGWRMRTAGGGRFVLIIDEAKAPRSARGGLGLGTTVFLFVFAALAIWSCPPAGIGLAVCALVWLIAQRVRRRG